MSVPGGARQDVLDAFLASADAGGEELSRSVRDAAPRVEGVANGTVVVLSPGDAAARKALLAEERRCELDATVRAAGAQGWRVDPPRRA